MGKDRKPSMAAMEAAANMMHSVFKPKREKQLGQLELLLILTPPADTTEQQAQKVQEEFMEALEAINEAAAHAFENKSKNLAAADEILDITKTMGNLLRVYCREVDLDVEEVVQYNNAKNHARKYTRRDK